MIEEFGMRLKDTCFILGSFLYLGATRNSFLSLLSSRNAFFIVAWIPQVYQIYIEKLKLIES